MAETEATVAVVIWAVVAAVAESVAPAPSVAAVAAVLSLRFVAVEVAAAAAVADLYPLKFLAADSVDCMLLLFDYLLL